MPRNRTPKRFLSKVSLELPLKNNVGYIKMASFLDQRRHNVKFRYLSLPRQALSLGAMTRLELGNHLGEKTLFTLSFPAHPQDLSMVLR